MNRLLYLFLVLSASGMVLYLVLLSVQSSTTFFGKTPSNTLQKTATLQRLEEIKREETQHKKVKVNKDIKTKTQEKKVKVNKDIKPKTQEKKVKVNKDIKPKTQEKKVKVNKSIKADAEKNSVKGKVSLENGRLSIQRNVSSQGAVFRGNASSPERSQKYVIYLCHRGQICGGWSDRQRGLVSVYLLSLVTGRQFGVHMLIPCNVTNFYLPTEVNWIIPPEDLVNKTSVVIQDMGSKGGVVDLLRMGDFNEKYPQDVVYIKTNSAKYGLAISLNKRYARDLPKWAKASRPLLFGKAWKILMRPSPFLQHRLDYYLQSIDYENRKHPLVGCHVRIGKSETLKTDGYTRMKVSDVDTLWTFVDRYVQNGSKLFLATDNLEVRNRSHQRFGNNVTDTGGSIVHVDKAKRVPHACEGFGYAVLDQLILSKCDVLILTSSDFGSRAAYMRGENKDLFDFKRNEVKPLRWKW